jgi:hypothetical protein
MADSNQTFQIIGIIVILAIVAFGIYYYMNMTNKKSEMDQNQMMAMMKQQIMQQSQNKIADVQMNMKENMDNQMSDPIMDKRIMTQAPGGEGSLVGENQMEHFANSDQMGKRDDKSSFPQSQLTAAELLPQDNSSQWAQVYPSGEGSLKDRNFLQAGYHIGINTVGQTLRNANQQLRSEPPNPQVKVSPWLQSTIEPDMGRKPFEIGGCM